MPEAIATYTTRVRGLWSTRHEVKGPEGVLGQLTIERALSSLVLGGVWKPVKGEVLTFRREPGLLRSQFSLWTEGREWLGSSLRPGFLQREVKLSTPNKEVRLYPAPGFGRGWRVHAPKTGELVRIEPRMLGRATTIQVFRRIEFEQVVFAYFLAFPIFPESFWPGPHVHDELETLAQTSKA